MPVPESLSVRLVEAACQAAEEGAWRTVTMAGLAQRAGVVREEAEARFPHPEDVLDTFARQIDERVADALDEEDVAEASPRERLLEALMCRWDFLAERRAAIRGFGAAAQRCPASAIRTFRRVHRSMGNLLDCTSLAGTELERSFRAAALAWIWIRLCRRWWLVDGVQEAEAAYAMLDRELGRLQSLERSLRSSAPERSD